LDATPLPIPLLSHGNIVDDQELALAVFTGEAAYVNGIESAGNGGLIFAVRTGDHGNSLPQTGC